MADDIDSAEVHLKQGHSPFHQVRHIREWQPLVLTMCSWELVYACSCEQL
jgi:hypothetical protein